MKIERILFATRFERLTLPAVEFLFSLKAAGLKEIVFLNVVDRDEVAFNVTTGFDHALLEELKEKARLNFLDWEAEVASRGIATRHLVELGSPEGKILEISCSEEVDLIVVGYHHTAVDALYPVGHDMEIVRRSSIPVLVFHPEAMPSQEPCADAFAHVVFPTDFSEGSARAFAFVKGMAGAVKDVELVHVIVDKKLAGKSPDELALLESERKAKLDAMAAELTALGVAARVHLLAGDTVQEMCRCIEEHRCHTVVMATSGKHGLKELIFGSPSHDVLEKAIPAVILVPPERAECYV